MPAFPKTHSRLSDLPKSPGLNRSSDADRRKRQVELGQPTASALDSTVARCAFNPFEDDFTRALIRRKAMQVARSGGFTPSDREDLEQELYMRILQAWRQFDPDQSHPKKFLTTVVERHAATLIRQRRANKRDDRTCTSLSLHIDAPRESLQVVGDAVTNHQLDARLGRKRREHTDLAELRADLAEVMATLPTHWQDFLERRKTYSVSEIATQLQLPRSTLNSWMAQIQARFIAAGIHDYF